MATGQGAGDSTAFAAGTTGGSGPFVIKYRIGQWVSVNGIAERIVAIFATTINHDVVYLMKSGRDYDEDDLSSPTSGPWYYTPKYQVGETLSDHGKILVVKSITCVMASHVYSQPIFMYTDTFNTLHNEYDLQPA